MEFIPTLFTLAGMHILAAMLPGPNTLVVSWLSATRSRREGLLAAGGVALTSLIWAAFALWGVGLLLLEAGWLYRALRLLGVAYLIYLGVRMIFNRRNSAAESSAPPPLSGARNPFAIGLITTLGNPKSAAFWTSVFLVAAPQHAPGWVYAAILAIIAAQSSLWYGGVALFLSMEFAQRRYLRMARCLDILTGGIMIALGLKLVEEVRRELTVSAAS